MIVVVSIIMVVHYITVHYIDEYMDLHCNIQKHRVEIILNSAMTDIAVVTNYPDVRLYMRDAQTSAPTPADLAGEKKETYDCLKLLCSTRPSLQFAYLLDRNGGIIEKFDAADAQWKKDGIVFWNDDILSETIKRKTYFPGFIKEYGITGWSCFASVMNDNEPLGFVALVYCFDTLWNTLDDSAKVHPSIFFTIIDNHDLMISSKAKNVLPINTCKDLNNFAKNWHSACNGRESTGSFTGSDGYVYYSCVEGLGWHIVLFQKLVYRYMFLWGSILGALIVMLCISWLCYRVLSGAVFPVKQCFGALGSHFEKIKHSGGTVNKRLESRFKIKELQELVDLVNALIDAIKRKTDELTRRVKYDSMTKLYNRQTFEQGAKKLISKYDPKSHASQSHLVFLFFDIDNFKNFNTLYGHAFGDRVIGFVGSILLEAVRDKGRACRYGGDEFVMCVWDKDTIDNLDEFVAGIVENMAKGIPVRDHDNLNIECSIGISRFPENGDNYESLINKADEAMYQIKLHGKGGVSEFSKKDKTSSTRTDLSTMTQHRNDPQ